ncbi:cytochrome c biogenesis protein ResB [Methylovorus sp. MP688]|uniref:cytochrome c biogenesis protein ResB n=1 Tax=Methylovorus sp. (strain MP688) TaxID=887061 RepID=UPI0001EC4386|nr:cytochrome c biogenesis protein ResB [Methylovorus sp. MP688]ADQ83453.1 ResB family protein [Methylovorus sp. MP688]
MRFAVSLLTVLGIASIIGTVLKQNEPYPNYVIKFGQFWFDLFEKLGLYDVYHSVWFLVILVFLVLSTSLCIYRNSPLMLRELRAYREGATEKSLRAFSHRASYTVAATAEARARIVQFLGQRGFRFKTVQQADGSELIAAKAGSYQRLGYILTHTAIVVICVGGLIDGNVPFKVQELLGYKKVETLDIPENEVPAISRLSVRNLSFRANMTLPEGASSNVSFMRIRDGYLVQELPFRIQLKQFRIEHYATGQPKSFESDLLIIDPDLKEPLAHTISVNHPLIYKGIAIYQSDFQDGGTKLNFNAYGLFGAKDQPIKVQSNIFKNVTLGEGDQALKVEFNDFRLFNILNLSPDGKGKPHNVGPNITYKVRDAQGQAREYVSYMQPLQLDGRRYFVTGMRATPQDELKYLRIPADEDYSLQGFMRLRATMFDPSLHEEIARRFTQDAMGDKADPDMRKKFQASVVQLLQGFDAGGYTRIAKMIEDAVPEPQREKAAQTYLKIISGATLEAYKLGLERAGLKAGEPDSNTQIFLQESLNAMSDLFFYGAPFYLQLDEFQQRQASGLQLTRSPGKNLVYGGSVLLVLGIFAMIYIRERRIWMLIKPTNEVLFTMSANRKNRDLDMEFEQYREQLRRLLQSE